MFACIGIAGGAGRSTQLVWDQRWRVLPAPKTPLTIPVRYEGTRVLFRLRIWLTKQPEDWVYLWDEIRLNLGSNFVEVQEAVASNMNTPISVLEELAKDSFEITQKTAFKTLKAKVDVSK